MGKVCKHCKYWISFIPGLGWVDEDDDDACYDEETLRLVGFHEPEN